MPRPPNSKFGTIHLSLSLHIDRESWEKIRDGAKTTVIYRCDSHWERRLVDRCYSYIRLNLRNPRENDSLRILRRKWKGCNKVEAVLPEFGPEAVTVFEIDVSEPVYVSEKGSLA